MDPIFKEPHYNQFFLEYMSQATQQGYAAVLGEFRRYLKKELLDANEQEINTYINHKKTHLKDGSTKFYMAGIAAYFKWLVVEKRRVDDPTTAIFKAQRKKLTATPKNPKGLDAEHRKQLFDILKWDTLHNKQVWLSVYCGFFVGMRLFEIAKLKFEEVDWEKHELNWIGKRRKERNNYIPAPLFEKLKAFKEEYGTVSEWVFFSEDKPAKHLSKSNVAKWSQTLKKVLDWPKEIKLSTHVYRHSTAQWLVDDGNPVHLVQEVMGHESPAMTGKYFKNKKTTIITAHRGTMEKGNQGT
jgi:integrase/recombinase XerD